jgi:hypothetical protein
MEEINQNWKRQIFFLIFLVSIGWMLFQYTNSYNVSAGVTDKARTPFNTSSDSLEYDLASEEHDSVEIVRSKNNTGYQDRTNNAPNGEIFLDITKQISDEEFDSEVYSKAKSMLLEHDPELAELPHFEELLTQEVVWENLEILVEEKEVLDQQEDVKGSESNYSPTGVGGQCGEPEGIVFHDSMCDETEERYCIGNCPEGAVCSTDPDPVIEVLQVTAPYSEDAPGVWGGHGPTNNKYANCEISPENYNSESGTGFFFPSYALINGTPITMRSGEPGEFNKGACRGIARLNPPVDESGRGCFKNSGCEHIPIEEFGYGVSPLVDGQPVSEEEKSVANGPGMSPFTGLPTNPALHNSIGNNHVGITKPPGGYQKSPGPDYKCMDLENTRIQSVRNYETTCISLPQPVIGTAVFTAISEIVDVIRCKSQYITNGNVCTEECEATVITGIAVDSAVGNPQDCTEKGQCGNATNYELSKIYNPPIESGVTQSVFASPCVIRVNYSIIASVQCQYVLSAPTARYNEYGAETYPKERCQGSEYSDECRLSEEEYYDSIGNM